MGPLLFEPIIKRIRWGGTRLGTRLNKPIGSADDAAESWEIADQPDGRSVVAAGPLAGSTLTEIVQQSPRELFGEGRECSQFPLLIKFLDAHDRLSVQVHPNDQQALSWGEHQRGKTEAWVIMDAEPGSKLFAGLEADVDRERFSEAIRSGEMTGVLHELEVQAGDVVFIPAGTVHAIAEGILLAEVQQQSNLTFRIHDWGRVGADGKPRQLHVAEALACTDFTRGPVSPCTPEAIADQPGVTRLARCDYFEIRRHVVAGHGQFQPADRFRILMVLAGRGELLADNQSISLAPGQTVLLPASCPAADLSTLEGLTLLETFVPDAD